MELIDKSALVAEIERLKHKLLDHIICENDKEWAVRTAHQLNRIIWFINDIEVKEVSMPALDNGNMPIKRWKEACKAASCQANYRKSKGLTETCDDYFVDGVQWADEHPIKMKDVDLEKELDRYTNSAEYVYNETRDSYFLVAKHFFELGLKIQKGGGE